MVRISAVVTLTTPGRIGWHRDVLKLPRLSPGRAPVRPGLFICGARSISPIPSDWMAVGAKKAPGEAGAVKYKGHSDRVNDGSPVRTSNVGRQASVPGRLSHSGNAIDVTVVHYRHVD